MRIALDAMGSDGAPYPEVEGAVVAGRSPDIEVVLVGNESQLNSCLATYPRNGKVSVVHASEVITMHDSPALAVRQKKDASLLVALRLAKERTVDAVVSAGNTGAVMIAARTILGSIRGVSRSAICQLFPTVRKPVLILDLGATVDCTARHLCDFAEMGTVYSQRALGVKDPRVGLLNIGEERVKGNELSKTVHRNLTAARHVNFIGNVEPRAMYDGVADVVVCDGFVGNVVLKTSEAAASLLATLVRRELSSTLPSRVGAFLSMGAFKRLKRTIDPNEYTGAPLLGINGTVIILHGSATARGVENAIQGACLAVDAEINEHIRMGVEELRSDEARVVEGEAKL
ncbi:MAG: phosphate acyltransferase PlsX [Candidatus Hydrogenedentes bacterium]|nr:phosphate acyltransferase PlsX [Candidatus Hydrogenedentota bacterium]